MCVFDGEGNEHRYDLPARSRGYLAWLPGRRTGQECTTVFAFMARGSQQQGHWFNPAKLLLDPCAHVAWKASLIDDPVLHGGLRRTRSPRQCHSLRQKAWWCQRASTTGKDDEPAAHAVGQNRDLRSARQGADATASVDLPEEIRGTYKALGASGDDCDYLKHLGITALELLPVAHFASEPRLQRLGLSQLLGLQPAGDVCACSRRYAAARRISARDEFRDAVKALHEAGIEVILDVVLNHSAESWILMAPRLLPARN